MESYRSVVLPRRLTKMYAETKRTCEQVVEPEKAQMSSVSWVLQRRLRIQKDRLITWGLDWSDANVAQPADIDDALDRAGLSDIVASVMSSIQELLEDAEQMRLPRQPKSPRKPSGEKIQEDSIWAKPKQDRARFEELLKDLTMSIDTLFDLSRSRRRSSQPSPNHVIDTTTTSRLSAEELPALKVREALKSETSKSACLPSQPDRDEKFSPTKKSEAFLSPYPLAMEQRSHTSLPPPYEAVAGSAASNVTLATLLQLTADNVSATVPNLEDRFRLAFNCASELRQLHLTGTFHGNISNKSMEFPRSSGPKAGDYYQGWRGYDIRNGKCSVGGMADIHRSSLYQHPMASYAVSQTEKQAHDVYSFGLVLLEIGFWMPLNAFWKEKYTTDVFKSRLENVYVKKLAAKCGSLYMRTVQYCLRAVDSLMQRLSKFNTSGMHCEFSFHVLRPLERCCLLDESYSPPSSEVTTVTQDMDLQSTKVSATGPHATLNPHAEQNCPVKRKLKIWTVPPPKEVLDEWNGGLLPCLERIMNRTVKNIRESFSADLMMVGQTSECLRPTVIVTCASVREVRAAIHRHLKYDNNLFDVKIRKGEISRSKDSSGRRRRRQRCMPQRSAKSSDSDSTFERPAMNPFYQQQPACGASIGAFRDNEHLPPVSLGGVILLDGKPYGMTVHHMLEAPSDDEDCFSEGDDERPDWSGVTPCEAPMLFETGDGTPVQYAFEISDDDDDGYSSAADDYDQGETWPLELSVTDDRSAVDDDNTSLGDAPGVDPDDEDRFNYLVTQPAIDDVEDSFFPREEDRDEEHLTSHLLGNVHASSGIRRRKLDGKKHEVDWALIKFNDQRLQHQNVVKGGKRYCTEHDGNIAADDDLYPHGIAATEELGGLRVHCLGRTSGLQGGTISSAMSLVKFQGRYSSSLSWHVVGNFGGKQHFQLTEACSSIDFLSRR